uniref:Uncharacterized protein n=1 Tax=Fagus sylvatica TaxID=28930 RepID=A0A2N9HG01_FAGSY
MAIVEGGVRIIMGVIAINRLLDVNLTIREVLAVYQYKCPGAKSNTLCHLVARNVNEKLVNGLPSTNKGFEKDYLRVGGIWFPGSSLCRSEFGHPDQKRLESARKQGDAELIRRVLSANFCVDERGEPRSAPLLLGYEPQVKSFLEGPTVPRSEAFEILPRAPYIAQPAETEKPEDYPDRIPVGQVYAMAPPINPFEPLEEIPITKSESRPIPERVPSPEPAKDQISEEPEQEEELQPLRDSIMDNPDNEVSGQIARGLAFATCLPEDMKKWAGTQPGPAFRQVTKNLIMATQGIMTMEAKFYRLSEKHQKTVAEHEKVMSDTLRAASENLKKLEDEISKKANLMKEAEERARAEETKRSEAEAEVARLQERVGKLESECISRLNKAHQEGMREGEGERDGGGGFRLGWKSALYKTEHPEIRHSSELFLRTGTPLPFPDAGLQESDDEGSEEGGVDEEEEEEEEEEEGEEGEKGEGQQGKEGKEWGRKKGRRRRTRRKEKWRKEKEGKKKKQKKKEKKEKEEKKKKKKKKKEKR